MAVVRCRRSGFISSYPTSPLLINPPTKNSQRPTPSLAPATQSLPIDSQPSLPYSRQHQYHRLPRSPPKQNISGVRNNKEKERAPTTFLSTSQNSITPPPYQPNRAPPPGGAPGPHPRTRWASVSGLGALETPTSPFRMIFSRITPCCCQTPVITEREIQLHLQLEQLCIVQTLFSRTPSTITYAPAKVSPGLIPDTNDNGLDSSCSTRNSRKEKCSHEQPYALCLLLRYGGQLHRIPSTLYRLYLLIISVVAGN